MFVTLLEVEIFLSVANSFIVELTFLALTTQHIKNYKIAITNCIAKMEVGSLKHPGTSTIGSQLLDGDCSHGWQILATHAVRGTGTRHTVETVERGRERGWEENCLGDELPHYEMQGNASCTYATLRYATIHKHMEFRHMRMCRHRWPPGERKCSLLLTPLNNI